MAILALPPYADIRNLTVTPPWPPVQRNESDWGGGSKIHILSHATRWGVSFELIPLQELELIDAKIWRSFITRLQGPANSFYLPSCAQQHSFTEPLVNGAASKGDDSLAIDGMSINQDYLDIGDYATIPLANGFRQNVMVRDVLSASGTGAGTLTFDPVLRDDVANDQALFTQKPHWELSIIDEAYSWDQMAGSVHDFGVLPCEEVY